MNIHTEIWQQLMSFYDTNTIPNIIFYGESNNGKKSIVIDFIAKIYNYDKAEIKQHVLYVNCSNGKGIKFVREELKLFCKSNINVHQGMKFKSIVFLNADNLTMEAQSALRRCIEIFTHNTRFFMIIENKNKLMKPILSRFCDIYVPCVINSEISKNEIDQNKINKLLKSTKNLCELATNLYELGYSSIDLINHYKNDNSLIDFLFEFSALMKEFRNEKFLIYIFLEKLMSLESIHKNLSLKEKNKDG